MRRRRTGTIVGIASVAGYRGFPRSEAYGATKAAEINMLEALRIDLRPMGITVQTVCPGFVRTDLTAKNTFPMPFMLEPDDAARRICRGIEREKAEIVFPFPMMLGMKALAARPGPALHGRVRGRAAAGAADVTEPVRHFERVDWAPRDDPPPDLEEWPFTIPAVAQLVAEGGLEIPAGVTFLIGENGSGKSTLVEALAAIYPRHGFVHPFAQKTGPGPSDEDSPLRWHLRAGRKVDRQDGDSAVGVRRCPR